MKNLPDTHYLLWILFDDKRLSDKLQNIIDAPENEIYVSIISFWEISLKFSIGKLNLNNIKPDELPCFVTDSGFQIMNISEHDAASFYKLPRMKHKDPFDRFLVWQSICEECIFITNDKEIASYESEGLRYLKM